MLRHFVALAALAAALALLPDPSFAAPAGFRAGGGVRIGGVRPIAHFRPQVRGPRHGAIRQPLLVSPRPGPVHPVVPHFKPVKIPPVATGAFTWPRSHLVRLNYGRHRKGGLILPVTGGDFGYFGTPYDPAEAIPVYAPQPLIQQVDADPPAETAPRSVPQLTRARGENQDACTAEKVTVPASEGEREITVVRC